MNDIENERVSTVIVKDQSRLGRDYLQTGLLMEITFPQYDVRFIAVNDGVDSINGVNDFSAQGSICTAEKIDPAKDLLNLTEKYQGLICRNSIFGNL